MTRLNFTDPNDARHFRPGWRVAWGSGREHGLAVVSEVDVASGTITMREPTRWERLVHWVTKPWRWVRWRWELWRFGLR